MKDIDDKEGVGEDEDEGYADDEVLGDAHLHPSARQVILLYDHFCVQTYPLNHTLLHHLSFHSKMGTLKYLHYA